MRISAAQEGKCQFVLLVSVHGADLQDLRPHWFVFSDVHDVHLLRELWPMIVGVNDTYKHL